ncbi:hypothetical protein FCM35_KLT12403 [Carex littledalei]|uniref:Uncharacterized protein n=1 Tax=Carex littledalei TaxID=544730 RepID=A0A833QR73_9POAL|nr:hypothetical protein FCM35_KLT12403 [Carex littledalei]
MELTTQKSRKSRMRFFTRRSSSINSNVSFKSVGSTLSFSSANSGSKDESFFESKLNFESDADEEFHSVHEETATPDNHATAASSNLNKSTSIGPTVTNSEKESSRSKLIDLLKEEQDGIKQEQVIESSNNSKLEKLSSIESRGSSVDEIPRQSKIMRNRSFKAAPCCVPCLVFTSCVKDRRKFKTDTGS